MFEKFKRFQLKLKAYWIIETIIQKCAICKKDKTGRFLIINLPGEKWIGICDDCHRGN